MPIVTLTANQSRHSLRVADRTINFIFERRPTRKKTMSISIDNEGSVLVRAPMRASMRTVHEFVAGKATWIDRKTAAAHARFVKRDFLSGELLDFQGRKLPLALEIADIRRVSPAIFANGALNIRVPDALEALEHAEWVKRALRLWYRPRAESLLTTMVTRVATETKMEPKNVCVKNLRSSWGICRGQDISLNWRLIMADPKLAEYVVYHELCHLKHKGHSKEFWSAVAAVFPDYKEKRQELRELDLDWI